MSQNKNQDMELNTMNITDDAFGLSDEMIQAYMDANAIETPDLWARVESGFDNEVKMMQQEMMPDNVQPFVAKPNMQMQPSMQTQSSIQTQPNMQMQPNIQTQSSMQLQPNMQQTNNTTGNVIDFSKRTARKKSIAAIAAIVILCIIAVPVMKMVGGNRQEDKGESKETTAVGVRDDTTANHEGSSIIAESDSQFEMEAETDSVEPEVTTVAETNDGGQSVVIVEAKGYFVYYGESLLFEIESMVSDPVGSIGEQSRILLYDSDATAAKYFERVDGKSAYGPFVVQMNVDEGTINSEQPEGILVEQQSISK